MNVAISATAELALTSVDVNRRLILFKGEVVRIRASQAVRVISGNAWITFKGQDILAAADENVTFERSSDFVVISPMGNSPLIVQISS
jgi:hypothetical protein